MRVKVVGLHNLFLFQDFVEYFLLTLKGKWHLPLKCKYERNNYLQPSASYSISES